ncbi:hypothetical protein Bpfe_002699 [Biomphalaria pfeifferi]|uniref:Sushi domain-containing protein n=1 Tax=Biomphalaria pfeifferi TaxID=112525 RepID=A0AAD8C870_BIOPF|nr:hypothetical protein Bpfe_002699 [Biomphalaria pfeifferi]
MSNVTTSTLTTATSLVNTTSTTPQSSSNHSESTTTAAATTELTSTTTSTTTQSTQPRTTRPALCPELNNMTTSTEQNDPTTTRKPIYLLSTTHRSSGIVVRVQCPWADSSNKPTYLLCQSNGQWNSSLPHCYESFELSSYKLFFALGGGALGLIVLVLSIIYCSLLREDRRKSSRQSSDVSDTTETKQVDPYHIGDRLYSNPSSSGDSTLSNSTFSKQAIFSTHVNPSFYEDDYDRWKKEEDTERLYDSPWHQHRGLKVQSETDNFKWSQSNLNNLANTGFQKIPRGFVSLDQISFSSEDSTGQESTTKSVDPLYASKLSFQSQTLHGVKRYRRMKSKELTTNTLPSKLGSSTLEDSSIGVTNL